MRAPELVERVIEDRELIVTMHKKRAAGVIDLVARAEIDVLQRVGHVDQTSDVHVDPGAPQQPAEDDEIMLEVGHRLWALALGYWPLASVCSFNTVFQFLAVPRVPSFFSMIAVVSFERPMPSG